MWDSISWQSGLSAAAGALVLSGVCVGGMGCRTAATGREPPAATTDQERPSAPEARPRSAASPHEAQAPAPASEPASATRTRRFVTAPAMYSANEEWLTFACELPDGQEFIGARTAVEMYWYSRYGLGNLLFRSGMGVHMVYNPLFAHHVAHDEGKPWYRRPDGARRFMEHKIAQFVARTAANRAAKAFPPRGAYPIYLEFASGVPDFVTAPQLDDFRTLRWDPAHMDRTMTPAGWGQTLLKQVLWARDFFTDSRRENGIVYLGNAKDDGGNGFRGAVLTAQAITKSFALLHTLAYDPKSRRLGGVDPMHYDPAGGVRYYPHRYAVRFAEGGPAGAPPRPQRFAVTDEHSELLDVASLIWGESEFYFFTDPKVHDDYDALFGDPRWDPHADPQRLRAWFAQGKTLFPPKVHGLARGVLAVNLRNLAALHFDRRHGTLVDRWSPREGAGRHVSTAWAGMASVALANVDRRVRDLAPLRNEARALLRAQARFLLAHQRDDGSIASGFRLGERVVEDAGAPTLLAQAFAMRAWLAAFHVTGDEAFREAAERTYGFLERALYSPGAGVYRSQLGATRSRYDGYSFGATLGALRELALVRHGEARRQVVARLDGFFERVAKRAGLQLAELGATGDPVPPPAQVRARMAKLAALSKQDPARARAMRAKMADSDGDGVPKPLFVAGTPHGAAPVQIEAVQIATP